MITFEESIQLELQTLKNVTNTDFCALALTDPEQTISWKFAFGNRNYRYQRIVLRLGKGIAGKVVASGRPMLISKFSPQCGDDPRDYPIMLAEGLQTAYGVPVTVQNRIIGVLLIGYRNHLTFNDEIKELTEKCALRIGNVIAEQGAELA